MPDATRVEFLRFGSSIPGAYWGCCAADIIQCFTGDPDALASIQMVDGDGACDLGVFAGPTNKDIFYQRLRVGTFGVDDMPNHAFFAIITQWQIESTNGKKWLKILKECGFEFLRTVSNSVYAGQSLGTYDPLATGEDIQHIFVLIRNIGTGGVGDPYTPPKEWRDLPFATNEFWAEVPKERCVELAQTNHKLQTEIWNKIGPAKFLTEAEVEAAGAPVIYAAKRDYTEQEEKSKRAKRLAKPGAKPTMGNPFEVPFAN
jgi:hypothetical protein